MVTQFITDNAERELLFSKLDPFSEQFILAARNSSKYKKTIEYLNTLDKSLKIKIIVTLTGKTFNKLLSVTDESLKENTQKLFMEYASIISYIIEGAYPDNVPIYKRIELENLIQDIPSLQNKLSIYHKLILFIPEVPKVSGKPALVSPPPVIKQYEIYGNLNLRDTYDYLSKRAAFLETDREKEVASNEAVPPEEVVEPPTETLPFDKQMEFINLPNKPLDLTGPFLLKWN